MHMYIHMHMYMRTHLDRFVAGESAGLGQG